MPLARATLLALVASTQACDNDEAVLALFQGTCSDATHLCTATTGQQAMIPYLCGTTCGTASAYNYGMVDQEAIYYKIEGHGQYTPGFLSYSFYSDDVDADPSQPGKQVLFSCQENIDYYAASNTDYCDVSPVAATLCSATCGTVKYPFTCPTSGASGDPHLHLAHGGKADVRGEPGGIYSMLSAKDLNMNIGMASADFHWTRRLIHGTKMSAAYWTIRTNSSSTLLKIEFSLKTASTGGKNHAVLYLGDKPTKVSAGHDYKYENVLVKVAGRGVTVIMVGKWEMTATLAPFPFANANNNEHLINVKAKALYDADHDVVAPHGLFGQSYDGDDVAVDGALDARNESESTTSAQAEGAIEGSIADYKVASDFSTEFKFSRFDATSAPHRDASKLSGKHHRVAKMPTEVGAADEESDVVESAA